MEFYIPAVILAALFGFLLRGLLLFTRKKYCGEILVTENDGITLYSLELNGNPEDIKTEKEVTFQVKIPKKESVRE